MNSAIKVLAFDLGNILVTFEERAEVLRRIIQQFGGDTGAVAKIFGKGNGEHLYHAIDRGEMCHKTLYEIICAEADIPKQRLDLSIFSSLYVWHLRAIEPVVAFVKTIQQNCRLVAVSNGDMSSRYVLEMLGAHYGLRFNEEYVSAEQGMKKPELIDVVVSKLRAGNGISPAECVMIDDVQSYVDRAIKLGMRGIVHNSTKESVESLAQKLQNMGVI